jgi:hypothetical protein
MSTSTANKPTVPSSVTPVNAIETTDSQPPPVSHYSTLSPSHPSTLKMTKFRPCIDLHSGSVKQIIGGTLSTSAPDTLKTNFVSPHPASYFAKLYKEHGLEGGHVIMLGPGNEAAAREALNEWPGGLQVGGGLNEGNVREWIEAGARQVGCDFAVG